ncbi:hypothetical protein [Cognatilysobacter segetis]|uniref:hypothetical protein n=1 Tax=Cognatilysobacter segetis TaxID=2492394 RepID=UPI00105C80B3|nr:hypothetical protein [Lysobacter segetis]
MNELHQALDVGWQARRPAVVLLCTAALAAAVGMALWLGPMAGLVVVLASALAAMMRMQWAALDGHALVVRDARTAYAYRALPARRIARVRFRRSAAPWCRVALEPDSNGACLVLSGPTPAHPTLRPVVLWMIVHGRRRARIDPCLLDALATMPEHGGAPQPHDASPA